MSWLPDWLTGFNSANADAAAAADAQLRQMNAADYSAGGSIYNTVAQQQGQQAADALAGKVSADYAAQDSTVGAIDAQAQRDQIQQTFDTKLQDQANSIIGGPLSLIGDVLKSVLKALPWWLWFAVAVVVFVWLGGPVWFKGILARKAKKK